jgi:hypothetical protein
MSWLATSLPPIDNESLPSPPLEAYISGITQYGVEAELRRLCDLGIASRQKTA